ncbi:MAG: HAD family hydrolase, partial [Planctomycetota bacterium]
RCGGAGGGALERAIGQVLGHEHAISLRLAGRTDRAIISEAVRGIGHDPDERFDQIRDRYLSTLDEELDRRDGGVLPGVVDLLERLRASGDSVLGLLTGNFRRGAEIKLRHFGLADYFDWDAAAFGDDRLDRNDVARDAFGRASARFAGPVLEPADVCIVGDTPNDVRCGRAIGARVVAVATGDFDENALRETGPDHLLPDLTAAGPWADIAG